MNYYQHHIGDFNNATRHLNLVERALYRDLIEMYYDAEAAIDGRDFMRLARRLLCRSDEEQQSLRFVLAEFFEEADGFYTQARCQREIEVYHTHREQQSRAGKASAAKRAANSAGGASQPHSIGLTDAEQALNAAADAQATAVEPTTKPLTTTHKPVTAKPLTTHQSLIKKNKASRQAEQLEHAAGGLPVIGADDSDQQTMLQQGNGLENSALESNGLEGAGLEGQDWKPALVTLNTKLKMAGGEAIDQTSLQQILVIFNPHYEGQCLSHNKRLAKLVAWVLDKQQRAKALQARSKSAGNSVRQSSAYQSGYSAVNASTAASDEPADHEVYSANITYGQLRKTMQDGETYLQCFQRIAISRQPVQAATKASIQTASNTSMQIPARAG